VEGAQQFPQLIKGSNPQSDTSRSKESPLSDKKLVDREYLINRINYINFQDSSIFVVFKHAVYGRSHSLVAKPLPCYGDILVCVWADEKGSQLNHDNYQFYSLQIPDGKKLIHVQPEVLSLSKKGIRFRLPESCWELRTRKVHRHLCHGIKGKLIQNSMAISGKLIDFNANTFRVEVTAIPPQTFKWFNSKSTVTALFSNETELLYTGECRIIRQTFGQRTRNYVLEPQKQLTHRFSPKQYRSVRYRLVPSPNVIFKHPMTQRLVDLNVVDLSGSGLSVEENEEIPVLLPGMMIPEMELSFAISFMIKCRGQVINKRAVQGEDKKYQTICGLAFLDMDPENHSRLLALLNQAKDKNAYISNVVEPEALWNFFFESGFIYPKKYAFVHSNKEKIKAVYEKLYTQCPSIARHFIYQDNGRILGHMSMVRFFGNSWMIHHHAANTASHNRAGVEVLSQITHYANDTYKIYSAHLDLVFCYFRPENKFPMKVFGGVSRDMKDTKGSSMDESAYFHCQEIFNNDLDVPEPWRLDKTRPEDLKKLEGFYEHVSGGLMLKALGLEPDMLDQDDVSEAYRGLGFKRCRYLYSLKKEGKLKAVALVNISDVGLNLSGLTNSINFIVVDPVGLTKDLVYSALSMLLTKFERAEMPILLYPVSYADSQSIPYEKRYALWTLNLEYLDPCFKFLSRLLRKI